MKFVAIIFVLALFVGGNEAWLRRRRRRTPTPCRPRNCQLSAWSQWSSCPCGASGTRNRTRRIIWPATCGGACFFHRSEMQFCKRDCQNSGIPTRNGCLCPHGFLGACCEIGKLNFKKKIVNYLPKEDLILEHCDILHESSCQILLTVEVELTGVSKT